MRENFTYGSVRGAAGDGSPYRDSTTTHLERIQLRDSCFFVVFHYTNVRTTATRPCDSH